MRWPRRAILQLAVIASLCAPAHANAEGHAMWIGAGGQIGYRTYGSFLRLGGGYLYRLRERLWLDLGAALLARKHTDIVLNGGIRWKLGAGASGWRSFIRAGGEVAILTGAEVRIVAAGHGGIGAGYFSGGGAGLVLEAGLSLGPAFGGGGVDFAIASDIMVSAEIPL